MAQNYSFTPISSGANPQEGSQSADASPEARRTLRMAMTLFHNAKAVRKRYDKDWNKYYEFGLRTKHWPVERPSFRASPVTNYIWAVIRHGVAIDTDGRPMPDVSGQTPVDMRFALTMDKALRHYWSNQNCDLEVHAADIASRVYGSGLFRVGYNPEAWFGLGDATMEAIDPNYFYPDPDATNFENLRYAIYALPTPLEEVKRKFAALGKDLGGEFVPKDPFDARRQSQEVVFTSPTDHRSVYSANDPMITFDNQERVLWIELWLNDTTTEEVEIMDKETESSRWETQKKYPRGRLITIVGNRILQDAHNPFEDGMIPFAGFANHLMPWEFWGQSDVEMLRNIQEDINKLDSQILEGGALMANAIWLLHTASGVDPTKLTNQQGLIVEWSGDAGQEPKRLTGVALPGEHYTYRNQRVKDLKDVAGMTDVSRGINNTPSGGTVQAGVAISELQEAQQTLIRPHVRNLEVALKRVGKLLLSRFMQFYTEPRLITVASEDGSGKQESFYFHFETDPATGKRTAVVQNMGPGQDGQPQPMEPARYPIKGWWDVTFDASSSLPLAKARKSQAVEKLMGFLQHDPGAQNPLLDDWVDANDLPQLKEKLNSIRTKYQPPVPQEPPAKVSVLFKGETLPPQEQQAILQGAHALTPPGPPPGQNGAPMNGQQQPQGAAA